MKVVTEAYLRSLFRSGPVKEFTLAEGQLLTPSARGFLTDRQAVIVTPESAAAKETPAPALGSVAKVSSQKETAPARPKYVSAFDGGQFDAKPEFMTHLKGNRLVTKDHDRIVFRGKLDSFQSSILMAQSHALEKGMTVMAKQLEDILDWVRGIMKADVLDIPLEKESVLDLTPDQLREHSHNPKKAYGVDHITPSADMGPALLWLNLLRSQSREMEIAGVKAFHREFEVRRPDILTALNRMSSALYIMMAREKAGHYKASSGNGTNADGQTPPRIRAQEG